jgi:hypothetical protein
MYSLKQTSVILYDWHCVKIFRWIPFHIISTFIFRSIEFFFLKSAELLVRCHLLPAGPGFVRNLGGFHLLFVTSSLILCLIFIGHPKAVKVIIIDNNEREFILRIQTISTYLFSSRTLYQKKEPFDLSTRAI